MIKTEKTLCKITGIWLLLAGSLLPAGLGWAETTPSPDNEVQTTVYFPTPNVTYNNIFIGKKLDIGLSKAFEVSLGDASSCPAGAAPLLTAGVLPSLWLPAVDRTNVATAPTPLIVRKNLPSGNTASPGKLTLQQGAPLYVREVEIGQREQSGTVGTSDLALAQENRPMGGGSFKFKNLEIGENGEDITLNKLEAQNIASSVSVYVRTRSSDYTKLELPKCEEGNPHWEKLNFGDPATKRWVMICGSVQKEPFETSYTCQNSTDTKLWCKVSSDTFYCDSSVCTEYRRHNAETWSLYRLTSAQHKTYCENITAGLTPEQAIVNAVTGISLCETLVTDWTTDSLSSCYTVTTFDSTDSALCTGTTYPPISRTTSPVVLGNRYTVETRSYSDCDTYCNGFND